jgi:hypothetical protein
MKNILKSSALALALALSVTACSTTTESDSALSRESLIEAVDNASTDEEREAALEKLSNLMWEELQSRDDFRMRGTS